MKPGDKIQVFSRLVRRHDLDKRLWREINIEPVAAIFLGWRHLSNGHIIRSYESYGYIADEHFKAALVILTSGKTNPFYCKISSGEEK